MALDSRTEKVMEMFAARPKRNPITDEQLVAAMERLDLHDGDVLIVHDPDLTPRITALRLASINFPVPVIVAKEGNLTKISVNDLRQIVRDYDDRNQQYNPSQAPIQLGEPEESSAPTPEIW